jgi:c-di-AMP phosphodiesterase-like protein
MKSFKITKPLKRKTELLICILFLFIIPITFLLFAIARLIFLPLIFLLIPCFIIFLFYLFYKIVSNCNSILLANGYKLSQNTEDIIFDGNVKCILNFGIDKVGWNENWIICHLKNVQSEYKWYAINLKTEEIVPPFSEESLRKNTDLNSIQYDTCENVWNKYHNK